jgi:hypothetical protein
MKRWLVRIAFAALFIVVGVILSLAVLITWLGTYPDDVDPKNVYYVLWKHGLNNNMNLDSALAAMSHDVWPVKQVQGLSKEQLKVRFGFIRTLDEATPYLRGCYETPTAAGQIQSRGNREDVAFLRDSPWMVVMKDGKAVDLVLCKGY